MCYAKTLGEPAPVRIQVYLKISRGATIGASTSLTALDAKGFPGSVLIRIRGYRC